MTIYRNFINGEWRESASSQTLPNINPANTNDVIGTVKLSTRAEARRSHRSRLQRFSSLEKYARADTRQNRRASFARLFEDEKEDACQYSDARRRQNLGRIARRIIALDQRRRILRGRSADV